MPPAATTQNNLAQRISEHDVLLTQLSTVVTELHENAKEDRHEARELQKAVLLLVERDATRQKWLDSLRNLAFTLTGSGMMLALVHFFHWS